MDRDRQPDPVRRAPAHPARHQQLGDPAVLPGRPGALGRGSDGARWTLTILAAIEDLVLLAGLVVYFVAATVGSILLGVVGLVVFVCVVLAIVAMH